MIDLKESLPRLLPAAIAWAEGIASFVQRRGQPLTRSEASDAKAVGVSQPGRIRVLEVDELPLPADPELCDSALQAGLLGPDIVGFTLGYSILVCRGHKSRSVMSHECRHVAQYEQSGSIAEFLPVYLASIVAVGYANSPFEREAQAFELPDFIEPLDS